MTARIRIRLLWHAQAQFAGYLVAQHRGLAASRGIDLECTPIDHAVGSVDAVLTGASEFAVASPAHLLESAAPDELSLVATIQQSSALVYLARRSDRIEHPADLAGKRVAVWPGGEDLELRWMLHRLGLRPAEVEFIPVADTVDALLSGDVSCAQMTVYHELHAFAAREPSLEDYVVFRADAVGASLIKDGLVARRDWLAAHPTIAQRVIDSVLAGWTTAFRDPATAVAVCTEVRGDMSPEEHARQLRDIRTLSLARATLSRGLGNPDQDHMIDALHALADVEGSTGRANVSALVDDRFWNAAPLEMRSTQWD